VFISVSRNRQMGFLEIKFLVNILVSKPRHALSILGCIFSGKGLGLDVGEENKRFLIGNGVDIKKLKV